VEKSDEECIAILQGINEIVESKHDVVVEDKFPTSREQGFVIGAEKKFSLAMFDLLVNKAREDLA